jgi:hypothetical protein
MFQVKRKVAVGQTIDEVLAATENLKKFLAIAESLGLRNILKEIEFKVYFIAIDRIRRMRFHHFIIFIVDDGLTLLAVSNDVELSSWEAEIAADPDHTRHIDRFKRHILTDSLPFDSWANVQPVYTMSEEILVISHRDGGK